MKEFYIKFQGVSITPLTFSVNECIISLYGKLALLYCTHPAHAMIGTVEVISVIRSVVLSTIEVKSRSVEFMLYMYYIINDLLTYETFTIQLLGMW